MALFIIPNEGLSCGDEESSRNCPARTCESCSNCYGFFDTRGGAGMKTIYKRDLPPVSLDGWQVTVLQLIFPTGFTSPKHVHPGFVLGYVLEGELRFHIGAEPSDTVVGGRCLLCSAGRHPSAFWQRERHQASQGSGCGFRRKRKGTNETPNDK